MVLGYIRGISHFLTGLTCVYIFELWYNLRKSLQSTPENINEPEKPKQNFQRCVLLVPNNGEVTQIDAFFKNKQVIYAILPPATEEGKYKTLYIKDLEVSDEFVITNSPLESRTEPCCFELICEFDSKDEAIKHIAEKISVYDQPKENQSIEDNNLSLLPEEEFLSIDDLAIDDIVIRKAQTNDAIQILRLLNYYRTGKLLEFQVLPKIPDTECNLKWFETGIPSDVFPYCFVKIDPDASEILLNAIMKIEKYNRPAYLSRQSAEPNDYDKQVGKYIHEYSGRVRVAVMLSSFASIMESHGTFMPSKNHTIFRGFSHGAKVPYGFHSLGANEVDLETLKRRYLESSSLGGCSAKLLERHLI
uniref:Uncharacterized protein n=1 Tax=Acrobeloides nanus TaxID=290746 RepID=A0A914CFW7_9BILA